MKKRYVLAFMAYAMKKLKIPETVKSEEKTLSYSPPKQDLIDYLSDIPDLRSERVIFNWLNCLLLSEQHYIISD